MVITRDGVRLIAGIVALHCAAAAPVVAQSVDTVAATSALSRFAAACYTQGDALWGRSLCGPIVLVHEPTRAAIANAPDPDGTFRRDGQFWFGTLPAGVGVANTAVQWGGTPWAMVLLPLPTDEFAQLSLMAHESFHRVQPELGLAARDALNAHLDDEQGRIWLRLELRALAASLRAPEGIAELRDALSFRSHRHALFPGADTLEAQLEQHEGLAEYTGVRFADAMVGGGLEHVLQSLASFERSASFVRSLGYGTGPAMGLLLDRHAPEWRSRAGQRPLHVLLAEAVGFDGNARNVHDSAGRYGIDAVATEEAARAAALSARLADIRRRLVDGPVLSFAQSGLRASFNPGELVPVPGAGTYYPTGTFQAEWGTLTVREGGALLSADWRRLQVPLTRGPVRGRVIEGDGWTLELADGWSIEPGEGGTWRVAPAK